MILANLGLQFSPKSVRHVLRDCKRARFVLCDAKGDEQIVDISFLSRRGFTDLLGRLREVAIVSVEQVDEYAVIFRFGRSVS